MVFEQYPETPFRYLTRAEVIEAARHVDLVGAVEDALRLHADGDSMLPAEAYLGWTTPSGAGARLLAMPGALLPDGAPVIGLKTINASLDNPERGIPRSQGFTLLLDPDTARPTALMEAAYISAMRTAAVTVLSANVLAVSEPRTVALLGCGALAWAHARLLADELPSLERFVLYDSVPGRAETMAAELAHPSAAFRASAEVRVADDPRSCVADAELVVTVTTVTSGYIEPEWLRRGTLVAHVSLDDLTERAVQRADLLVVDDWSLVADDPRRLLGRMYRAGTLLDPDGKPRPETVAQPGARRVDAALADILTGRHPGRRDETDIVVSNPFGMALLDVAVAHRVHLAAQAADIGRQLTL